MKRCTAIKKLMSLCFDRNEACLYLDIMHAFNLTNSEAVLNRVEELKTGITDAILISTKNLYWFKENNIRDTVDILGV